MTTSHKPQTLAGKDLDLVQPATASGLCVRVSEQLDGPSPNLHMLNLILSGMGPRQVHLGRIP